MPEPVARLFAGALVRHAIVTFPHAFAAGALHSSPLLRKRGLGHHLLFLHATQVHDALRLFEAGFFDWSMQAQAAFLSPPGLPPPVLTDIHLNLVRNGDRFDELSAAGVTGLFLPGVDGDVAGLFTFSDDLWDSLIREIRDRCEKSGAAWREAPEDEFRELLISRLA